MADSKGRHDWDQTSLIWATIANTVRDSQRKSSPYLPADVHPYRHDREAKQGQEPEFNIEILKVLLNNA